MTMTVTVTMVQGRFFQRLQNTLIHPPHHHLLPKRHPTQARARHRRRRPRVGKNTPIPPRRGYLPRLPYPHPHPDPESQRLGGVVGNRRRPFPHRLLLAAQLHILALDALRQLEDHRAECLVFGVHRGEGGVQRGALGGPEGALGGVVLEVLGGGAVGLRVGVVFAGGGGVEGGDWGDEGWGGGGVVCM